MHKKLLIFLEAFFNDHDGDASKMEKAIPQMPDDIQAEWERFHASTFYPDKMPDYLSFRGSEIQKQLKVERCYGVNSAATELTD